MINNIIIHNINTYRYIYIYIIIYDEVHKVEWLQILKITEDSFLVAIL